MTEHKSWTNNCSCKDKLPSGHCKYTKEDFNIKTPDDCKHRHTDPHPTFPSPVRLCRMCHYPVTSEDLHLCRYCFNGVEKLGMKCTKCDKKDHIP